MSYLIWILIILVVIVLGIVWYHGLFKKVKLVEEDAGPYVVVVKEHIGPYSGVKPTMDAVYEGLKELGIETTRGVGLYHDDPAKQAKAELRSEVGSILEEQDLGKRGEIEQNFTVKDVARQRSVVARFPIRSVMSYMAGPMKVYPAMSKYWKEKGYKEDVAGSFGMEIYDEVNKTIVYVMAIPE